MSTRDAILDAAARLYAEAGSRGATTRKIAERAGVNEVTLFRHFGSKEVLLREALRREGELSLERRLPEEPVDPESELTGWARHHMRALYEARAMLRTGMGEFEERPEVGAFACDVPARVAGELEQYLRRMRERGMMAAGVEVETASAVLMASIFTDAISRDIMPDRFRRPMEEAAARYVAFFLRAVEPGRR